MENRNEQSATVAGGEFVIGSDLPVSRLGFGAMRITGDGVWGPPQDKDAAIAVLKRTQDLGITLIDTAESYGPDVSESLIAEALYPYPKGLVIATKGGLLRPGPNQFLPDGHPLHLRKALEVGFIPWHPRSVGELARPGSVLDEVAKRYAVQPGQIALAWLLQRSPTILPIPGTSSVKHLEENVEGTKIRLSQDEFEGIRRATQG